MFTEKEKVLVQYQNSSNLEARIALHKRFSTAKHDYHAWLFDSFQIPENANVLELGSGSAKLWQVNQARIPVSWHITLSDISEGMLNDAKQNVSEIPANFSFQVIDAQEIPFEDRHFDVVMANSMLYHVPNVDKAIGEIRRVLKPDGRFYAATGGLTHMKELNDFIEEHLATRLSGKFVGTSNITANFALENGEAQLRHHFANVKLHVPPKSYLHVTETEPLIRHIQSMAGWFDLVGGASTDFVDTVLDDARKVIEKRLPFHISTSAGLFEAW
ncbi:MAG: class I SAM-dependent methyltransferase [Trueperaceae bacterium]